MKVLKFKLRDFIKDVYKIDIDSLLDYDNFYFENFSPDSYDKDRFEELLPLCNINIGEDEDMKENLLSEVVNRRYESSYIDDYSKQLISDISDKIINDFDHIKEVMEYEISEANINSDATLKIKLDWYNDTITFTGKLTLLDVFVVNCINGCGFFRYSLDDFKREGSIHDRIEGHLHWLHKFEEIYGTIYNIFTYDTSSLSRYYNFGDTYFSTEDIIEAYAMIA